jgi:DNA-binding CsgD family transcriptional regulator
MLDCKLTEREEEILALVARGKSNKDIAKTLFLSVFTVQTHLSNINQKLGASNRTEAAWSYWKKNIQGIVESTHGFEIYCGDSGAIHTARAQGGIKIHHLKKILFILVTFTLLAMGLLLLLSVNRTLKNPDLYYSVSVNGTNKNLKVGDVVVRGIRSNQGYCEFPEVEENEYLTSSIHYASVEYIVEGDCDLILSSILLRNVYASPEPPDPAGSFIEPLELIGDNE